MPTRALACLVAVLTLGWSATAWAGWTIDQVVTGGGDDRQQVLMQANRMKTVLLDRDGKPEAAFILDLDADTITQVDYKERRYSSATTAEYVAMIHAGAEVAARQLEQMKDALKDMPAEQRAAVERMLQSRLPSGGECRPPDVKMRKTGQAATIAGFPAQAYELVVDGQPDSEVWLAAGLTAWRELDPAKLERVMTELAKASPDCSTVRGRTAFANQAAWKAAGEGYPVRTVSRTGAGTIEVTAARQQAIAAAEFQPPAGFQRTALPQFDQ